MKVLRQPLRFRRTFVEKLWGGRGLERTPGIELPEGVSVGETWEIADRGEVSSVVAGGEHAGLTLRELVERHAGDLLGSAPATPDGRFPLLVKYLDANDNLSVQVHPDDETAPRTGGGAQGKTEAWYFLDVAPGGAIYAGLKSDVTRAALAQVAGGPSVIEALVRWDVRPGQCMLVPGGTVHAIGAGVCLLEVQQNSDTTYRLWDWGRTDRDGRPRETRVDAALDSVRFDLPQRAPVDPAWEPLGDEASWAAMVRSPYFALNALVIRGRTRMSTHGRFQIYAVTAGSGRLSVGDLAGEHRLGPGDVRLVPAAAGFHYFEPESDQLALVQMTTEA